MFSPNVVSKNLNLRKENKMATYTVTAKFHVDFDNDPKLLDSENYVEMLDFVESILQGSSGVHFIEITDVEED